MAGTLPRLCGIVLPAVSFPVHVTISRNFSFLRNVHEAYLVPAADTALVLPYRVLTGTLNPLELNVPNSLVAVKLEVVAAVSRDNGEPLSVSNSWFFSVCVLLFIHTNPPSPARSIPLVIVFAVPSAP